MSPLVLFPEPQTRTARMTARQHLSSESMKVTTCFDLDDCYDDDYETFANMVDGEVSLSMETTKQISPTPIAVNAVDIGEKTFLTSTPQTTTTGHGQSEMNTNRTGSTYSRVEHTVVC